MRLEIRMNGGVSRFLVLYSWFGDDAHTQTDYTYALAEQAIDGWKTRPIP